MVSFGVVANALLAIAMVVLGCAEPTGASVAGSQLDGMHSGNQGHHQGRNLVTNPSFESRGQYVLRSLIRPVLTRGVSLATIDYHETQSRGQC